MEEVAAVCSNIVTECTHKNKDVTSSIRKALEGHAPFCDLGMRLHLQMGMSKKSGGSENQTLAASKPKTSRPFSEVESATCA